MTAAKTPFRTRISTRLPGGATRSQEGTSFNNCGRCIHNVLLSWQKESPLR